MEFPGSGRHQEARIEVKLIGQRMARRYIARRHLRRVWLVVCPSLQNGAQSQQVPSGTSLTALPRLLV